MSKKVSNAGSNEGAKSQPKVANGGGQKVVKDVDPNDVDYDDELDETFEGSIVKGSTTEELEKTVESFEDPKGVEDTEDSSVSNGPQIDIKDIEKLRKHMASLPRAKMMEMLQNMMQNGKFGLGDNDFSKVSAERATDAKSRLRAKLAQQQMARKSKVVRNAELERATAKTTELKEKKQASVPGSNATVSNATASATASSDKVPEVEVAEPKKESDLASQVEDLDDNPSNDGHVHSASCSHGHAKDAEASSEAIRKNKNARKHKNRRAVGKK